jgi:iron complex outermembrane recepter protein
MWVKGSTAVRGPGVDVGVWLSWLLLVLPLCCPLVCQGSDAALLDQQVTVAIPADTPLDDALIGVARQLGIGISVAREAAAHRTTRALRGTFTATAILEALLEKSGLVYELDDGAIWVKPAIATLAPSSPSNGSNDTKPGQTGVGPTGADGDRSPTHLEEVVVRTGSHIHGVAATAPVYTFDREYFESCGCQTVAEVLDTLPQNFGGGYNSDAIGAGSSQNATPFSGANTANLRGLGSGSTLTLLNGFRLASSEGSGATDLTQIPLAAVEQIEVMPGGASAIYGSDAVAGVVNIILREDYQGVEGRVSLGGPTDGGGFTQRYGTAGGYRWDAANAFGTFECDRQNAVDSSQRSFILPSVMGTTLLPRTRFCSMLADAKVTLADRIEASFLSGYTRRTNDQSLSVSPSSPDLTVVTAADVEQFVVGADVSVPLFGSWTGGLMASASGNSVTGSEVLEGSTPAPMREADVFRNRLRSIEVTVDGTLLSLPTGDLKLAVGGGDRRETFQFNNQPETDYILSRARSVQYGFTELNIPLIASAEGTDGPHTLTLSLAARQEHYSDVGSTTNPQVTLDYWPLSELKILASWGRSFRAPSLLQQYDTTQITLEKIPDPFVSAGESLALLRFGANPQLKPEKSLASALDLSYTPAAWQGASFELMYYYIVYEERIEYPTADTTDPLVDRDVWPFIQRNPSAGYITSLVDQSQYTDLAGSQYNATDAGLVVDDRYQNISRQLVSGVDFRSGYTRQTDVGRIGGSANVAWLDLLQRVSSESAWLPLSGTLYNPPSWRARVGASWADAGYEVSAFVNDTGPSRDLASSPPQRLASWTTFDTQVGYTSQHGAGWGVTHINLAARNLFDRRPPSFNIREDTAADINFDSTNTSALGLTLSLQVVQSW